MFPQRWGKGLGLLLLLFSFFSDAFEGVSIHYPLTPGFEIDDLTFDKGPFVLGTHDSWFKGARHYAYITGRFNPMGRNLFIDGKLVNIGFENNFLVEIEATEKEFVPIRIDLKTKSGQLLQKSYFLIMNQNRLPVMKRNDRLLSFGVKASRTSYYNPGSAWQQYALGVNGGFDWRLGEQKGYFLLSKLELELLSLKNTKNHKGQMLYSEDLLFGLALQNNSKTYEFRFGAGFSMNHYGSPKKPEIGALFLPEFMMGYSHEVGEGNVVMLNAYYATINGSPSSKAKISFEAKYLFPYSGTDTLDDYLAVGLQYNNVRKLDNKKLLVAKQLMVGVEYYY